MSNLGFFAASAKVIRKIGNCLQFGLKRDKYVKVARYVFFLYDCTCEIFGNSTCVWCLFVVVFVCVCVCMCVCVCKCVVVIVCVCVCDCVLYRGKFKEDYDYG